MTPPLRLEPLTATHSVAVFASGDDEIDAYLHSRALVEQAQGLAAVYVAIDHEEAVVGFFTLSPVSLRVDANLEQLLASRNTPYPQLGGYLLGRMGVDRRSQRQGLGGALIAMALDIARTQRVKTGGVFLAVDPKSQELCRWYETFGFAVIDPQRKRLRMILALV